MMTDSIKKGEVHVNDDYRSSKMALESLRLGEGLSRFFQGQSMDDIFREQVAEESVPAGEIFAATPLVVRVNLSVNVPMVTSTTPIFSAVIVYWIWSPISAPSERAVTFGSDLVRRKSGSEQIMVSSSVEVSEIWLKIGFVDVIVAVTSYVPIGIGVVVV